MQNPFYESIIIKKSEDLETEIANYINIKLWKNRDLSKKYGQYGNKSSDVDDLEENYFNTSIFTNSYCKLLKFSCVDFQQRQSEYYVINLKTLKPTNKSIIKKELTNELKEKINLKYNSPKKISNNYEYDRSDRCDGCGKHDLSCRCGVPYPFY